MTGACDPSEMECARPVCNSQSDLNTTKILSLLKESSEEKKFSVPPQKPKGGKVYLFSPSDDSCKQGEPLLDKRFS